jgi:hypothetical protein
MIKQSFLDTLVGLPVAEAEKAVFLEGHEFASLPEGSARIALAVPNTVFLDYKDGKVTFVSVGNPLEVETSPKAVVQ